MLNESKFLELQNRQQESGLNVKDFCLNECIAESTFYYWRKKFQKGLPSKGFIRMQASNPKFFLSHRVISFEKNYS